MDKMDDRKRARKEIQTDPAVEKHIRTGLDDGLDKNIDEDGQPPKSQQSPATKTKKKDKARKGKHPLFTPTVPASPPVDSIVLDIPGHSGYVLTTPTEDDAYYMEILLAVHRNTGPKNVKKPYNKKNIKTWLDDILYFHNKIRTIKSSEEHHAALFDFDDFINKSIPFQMIRHNGKFVGHCALTPENSGLDPDHPTEDKKFVKLSFLLWYDHQQKGVMFTIIKQLLIIAAEQFHVDLVYATSDNENTAANRLLEGVIDWSKQKWGGSSSKGDKLMKHYITAYVGQRETFDIERRRGTWWLWEIGDRIKGKGKAIDQDAQIRDLSPELLNLDQSQT